MSERKRIFQKFWDSGWLPLVIFLIVVAVYHFFLRGVSAVTDRGLGFIVGSGLFLWLVQKTIDTFLKNRFESFKLELSAKSEEYKMGLEKQMSEFQSEIRYRELQQTNLFQQRADNLAELYFKLIHSHELFMVMTADWHEVIEDEKEEAGKRIKEAIDSFDELKLFYAKNKIFFPKHICDLFESLFKEFRESLSEYTFRIRNGLTPSEGTAEMAQRASARIRNTAPEILKSIEITFRTILGFDQNKDNETPNQ